QRTPTHCGFTPFPTRRSSALSVVGLARPAASPSYFILTAPNAVRFDGNGFFGLAAGAPNPDGTTFGVGSTRAIVPLHTAFAAMSDRKSTRLNSSHRTISYAVF